MTTALFLLRAAQVGIDIEKMDNLTVGMVLDIFTESVNDEYEYPELATQEDFDNF